MNEEKLNKINEAASLRCSVALSKLINRKIEVVFSQPVITKVKEIPSLISSQEIGAGVYLPISGGALGSALFLLPKQTAFNLCDLTMKKKFRTIQELTSPDEALLKEMGNILLGNYLAILSNTLKTEITEGMPHFSFGIFGAILEEVIVNLTKDAPEALVVKIEFIFKARNIKGRLLLIFKSEGIEALLNAL